MLSRSKTHRLLIILGLLICIATQSATAQSRPSWVQTLEDIIDQEIAHKRFPSFSLVLVNRHGIIAEITRGRTSIDGGQTVTPTTLYRTGSVGKTLTDIAVMRAVEQGRVDLDVDVGHYLPDFQPNNPFDKPITLRQLMTHTAGLVREPPIGNYFDATSPSLERTVLSLNGTSLLWEPGTRTKYSNGGLAVVGRVLEIVYDQSYAQILERLVFQPAGMTTATVGRRPEMEDRAARGIMEKPDGTIWDAPTFDLGMSPAGDLYASTRDMGSFMISLLSIDGPVLQSTTLQSMWTPNPPRKTWQIDVGLGFSLNGKFADKYQMARNGGAVYGFATELALLPEEGFGVYAVAAKDLANTTVQAIAHWALLAAIKAKGGESPTEYKMTPIPFPNLLSKLAACSSENDGSSESDILGTYGWEHNPLVICRKDGRVYALIEWFFLYPLTKGADGAYKFPSYALYGHEQIRFIRGDQGVTEAVLGMGREGIRFPRL